MNDRALDVAIVASAALAIVGAPFAFGVPALVFVFKPLTTVLILLRAWPRGHDAPRARQLLRVGLVLSLAGDIALLWPKEGFLPGLVAFLLAHLCYIGAFTRGVRFAARWAPFAVYAAVAAGVLSQLWPHVPGALRAPVMAYVVALAAMASQAAVVWLVARDGAAAPRTRMLAIGGALFLCSDALLAINKFATPLPAASLWILATYWSAQWCIAQWLSPRNAPTS